MKKINGVCRTTAKLLSLTTTIVVNPGDPPYDCQGAYIVPPILNGQPNPETHPDRYRAPSTPQVGFYVSNPVNAEIRNCKIIGFDFGIFAVKGKTTSTSTNKFDNNEIIAHYAGISLLEVDRTEVTNNTITLTHLGGRAINVQWNSDWNTIRGNTLIGDFDSTRNRAYAAPSTDTSGVLMPGVKSNPLGSKPHMVFIGTLQGTELSMMTSVVNGDIQQFQIEQSPPDDTAFSENNTFDSNSIRVPLNMASGYDGILLSMPRHTTVSNNMIYPNTKSGIRIGTQLGFARDFPGFCDQDTNNPPRRCFDASECSVAPPVGQCVNASINQPVSSLWTSVDNTLEANKIYAPFSDIGIATAGRKTKIVGNIIDLEPGAATPTPVSVAVAAIAIYGNSFGNSANPDWGATITRNSVSNVRPALGLIILAPFQTASPQDAFTARIGLNDFFTVYATVKGVRTPLSAVRVMSAGANPAPYYVTTDISINFSETLQGGSKPFIWGNFWGLECPDRFFPSDSNPSIVEVVGGINANVRVDDSHALDDTVTRTLNLLQMPSPQPSRCPKQPVPPVARLAKTGRFG